MKKSCPVCSAFLVYNKLYEYVKCDTCGSYIYISDRTAEDDNRIFYNSVFSFAAEQRYSMVKKKLFRYYDQKDKKKNRGQYLKLDNINAEINSIFQENAKIMEVGFGEGRHLLRLLESGYDAYGIDLADDVVSAFKQKYPQYKDCVRVGTDFDEKVDVVYCSALIEHLDSPGKFVDNASSSLAAGGFLIINAVPVINERNSNIDFNEDICFWKPCHRVIFSHKGITGMLHDKGYALSNYSIFDVYNYKLLSLHLKNGYDEIINIRHTCVKDNKLPGMHKYFNLCREALHIHSFALAGVYIFCKQ